MSKNGRVLDDAPKAYKNVEDNYLQALPDEIILGKKDGFPIDITGQMFVDAFPGFVYAVKSYRGPKMDKDGNIKKLNPKKNKGKNVKVDDTKYVNTISHKANYGNSREFPNDYIFGKISRFRAVFGISAAQRWGLQTYLIGGKFNLERPLTLKEIYFDIFMNIKQIKALLVKKMPYECTEEQKQAGMHDFKEFVQLLQDRHNFDRDPKNKDTASNITKTIEEYYGVKIEKKNKDGTVTTTYSIGNRGIITDMVGAIWLYSNGKRSYFTDNIELNGVVEIYPYMFDKFMSFLNKYKDK